MERMVVFFHDEWPAIGSGWRAVEVTIGYKWVTLRSKKGRSYRRKRFTKAQWKEISVKARPVDKTKRTAREWEKIYDARVRQILPF